ncbi:MAG: Pilus formation protein terminal region [Myxococcaceae bacterium]|nr:Pilus formation protein terminal region [Myxococcaceae bacterium]
MRVLALMCGLVSMAAIAGDKRVNMPVGYSTTVELPANVTKVVLSDPRVVDVSRNGRKVTFTGQNRGSTSAIVHVKEGRKQTTHRLAVYVATDKYALPY